MGWLGTWSDRGQAQAITRAVDSAVWREPCQVRAKLRLSMNSRSTARYCMTALRGELHRHSSRLVHTSTEKRLGLRDPSVIKTSANNDDATSHTGSSFWETRDSRAALPRRLGRPS